MINNQFFSSYDQRSVFLSNPYQPNVKGDGQTENIAPKRIREPQKLKQICFRSLLQLTSPHFQQERTQQIKELERSISEKLPVDLKEELWSFAVSSNLFSTHHLSFLLDKKMQLVNLSGCLTLTDLGVKMVSQVCPNLLFLDLSWCSYLSNECFKVLGTLNLKNLSIQYCPNVDDETLSIIGGCFKNLISLNLTGCRHITEQGIEKLVQGAKSIKVLNLSSCRGLRSSRAIKHLSNNIPGINWLSLNYANLSDEDCSRISKLKDLEFLSLSDSEITDISLLKILVNCQKLKHLELSCCSHLTDKSCENLARNLSPRLTHLSVLGCSFKESGFRTLLSSLPPGIQWLDLSYCKDLTDSNLSLCTTCNYPNLYYLNLTWCSALSHAAVFYSMSVHPWRRILYVLSKITQ